MKYARAFIAALGYELAPVVVTSTELEARLEPLYRDLRFVPGQLQALTGIRERRWWEPGYPLSRGAIAAGNKALDAAGVSPRDVGMLIYAGVCREQFEPATACRVAAGLGIGGNAAIFDISNACLGVLNGILEVSNRIELGQIRAGLVVSCESAREINDIMIDGCWPTGTWSGSPPPSPRSPVDQGPWPCWSRTAPFRLPATTACSAASPRPHPNITASASGGYLRMAAAASPRP